MQPPEDRIVDWTGVHPDDSPIAPLDGRSFLARLRILGERTRDLTLLRSARTERPSHAERLPRDPERAFDELKQRAVEVKVDQRTFFVASIDDLISMKQRAGRPQDLLDIAELRKIQERLV